MVYKLTNEQNKFLGFIAKKKITSFYFTGGTALSHYYLKHRFSEDLDFFSEEEFKVTDIVPVIGEAKRTIGFNTFDYQQSFNRNIYELAFPNSIYLKVEFTYFPFTQIERPKSHHGVLVDSLMDIAVNKVFTITQQSRGRDYYDLYAIVKKTNWALSDLLSKARVKFDWHIDYLQLGSQFLKIESLLDDPILTDTSITKDKVVDFFKKESALLGKKILSK